MSRIDIPKLAGIPPVSPVGTGTRANGATEQSRAAEASRAATNAAPQGVNVELSNRVEAGQPPVDADRVAEIRAALQDGSYPIVPTEIADALIAARLMMGYEK